MKDKIRQIVVSTLAEVAGMDGSAINDDTPVLAADGMLDSMGIINFILGLESAIDDELSITVSLADENAFATQSGPFRSVASIVEYVEGKLSAS